MKKLRFDRKYFVRTFKKASSVMIPALAYLLFMMLVISLTFIQSFTFSDNIFAFNGIGDTVLVSLYALASLTIIVGIVLFGKKKKFAERPLYTILLLYGGALVVSSVIPIFEIGTIVNAETAKNVVHNTYVFYYTTIAMLIIMFILTVFLLRNRTKQTNWWLFFTALPYIAISWSIQSDFSNFSNLVNRDYFTYNDVAEMIEVTQGDIMLINELWYKVIAYILVVLVLMIGMMIIEKTWNKTKNWR